MSIKKFIIFPLIIVFSFLAFGSFVVAQDETLVNGELTAEEMVAVDENVTNEDLGLSEPTLLPDSPLYFLKNFYRRISDIITIDKTKKMENRLKWANERLSEVKKLSEIKKDPELLEGALDAYQGEVDKVKEISDRINREELNELQGKRLDSFLDKFTHQQVLHQRILEKLEQQVPEQVFQKIQQTRERHLEKFGEVMGKLEKDPEKLMNRVERALEDVKGSQFKDIKSLDILKKIEEVIPQNQRRPLEQLRSNIQERLKVNVRDLPEQGRERFFEYLDKAKKGSVEQLNIIQELNLEKEIPQIRNRIIKKIETQLQLKKDGGINCPEWQKPAENFCLNGKIYIPTDERGCKLPAKCVMPEKLETQKPGSIACIALWDPVCGADGTTYSNSCWASVAGVKVVSRGPCEAQKTQLKVQENIQLKVQENAQLKVQQKVQQNINNKLELNK